MAASGKPCPVANECSMMRTMTTSGSSGTPSTQPSIPSSLPSSFFENPFYDSLINFMLQCSRVVEETHRRTGRSEIQMSPEERQVRIQELMSRIAEKERELSQLEEERRNMLSNYDASVSSAGSGPAFTPPARAARQRGAARRIPRSPYQQSQEDPCAAGCIADCSMSMSANAEPSYQPPAAWRQRRIMSTPERRSARPPAFDTSGYNTSNGPGGCDPSCQDPCHTMDESLAQWHRRLM